MTVDKLSWRPRTESNNINEVNEGLDIDDFIDTEFNAFQIMLIVVREYLQTENHLQDDL